MEEVLENPNSEKETAFYIVSVLLRLTLHVIEHQLSSHNYNVDFSNFSKFKYIYSIQIYIFDSKKNDIKYTLRQSVDMVIVISYTTT